MNHTIGIALVVVSTMSAVMETSARAGTRESHQPAATSPGPRRGHTLVYHDGLRRVLLVDASPRVPGQARAQEIWSWDGARWELLQTSNSNPEAHSTNASVYDSSRERVVMHGGRTRGMGQEDVVNQTWEWSPGGWSQSAIGSARDHHSMAYDSSRNRTVMFGGGVFPRQPGAWATDTWEFDGKEWKRVATDGPTGRIGAMAYDSARRETIMFGGHGDGQPAVYFGDTWAWDGKTWRKAVGVGPSPRTAHALSFDPRASVVLLYGGGARADGRFQEHGDMWQWDGHRWSEIKMTGVTPGRRTLAFMAYDAARDKTVLYGGGRIEDGQMKVLADTWEWDGKQWKNVR